MTRTHDLILWFAILVVSVFALGFVAGDALGAAPTTCNRVYPASPTIVHHGRLLPLHPVLADYARCVRVAR